MTCAMRSAASAASSSRGRALAPPVLSPSRHSTARTRPAAVSLVSANGTALSATYCATSTSTVPSTRSAVQFASAHRVLGMLLIQYTRYRGGLAPDIVTR